MFATLSRTLRRTLRPNRLRPARLARNRPALETLEGRVVLSLSAVSPYAGYPYTAVVKIQATFPDRQTYVGSGAMIDTFHVLTAGHMLYSYKDGGLATSVQVIPEMYYSRDPYGIAYATYERVDGSFVSYNRSNPGSTSTGVNDIGLLTLNRAVGSSTGWFGFGYNNSSSFYANAYMTTAGYPASYGYNGQQMYLSQGREIGLSGADGLAFYEGNITDVPGQSGSPLWQQGSNGPTIYGVISGFSGTSSYSLGYASRITPTVFNELQSWRLSDRAPSAKAIVLSGNAEATSAGGKLAGDGIMPTDADAGPAPVAEGAGAGGEGPAGADGLFGGTQMFGLTDGFGANVASQTFSPMLPGTPSSAATDPHSPFSAALLGGLPVPRASVTTGLLSAGGSDQGAAQDGDADQAVEDEVFRHLGLDGEKAE